MSISLSAFSRITTEVELDKEVKEQRALIQRLPDYQALAAAKEEENKKFAPQYDVLMAEREGIVSVFKEEKQKCLDIFKEILEILRKDCDRIRREHFQGDSKLNSLLNSLKEDLRSIVDGEVYKKRVEKARERHQVMIAQAQARCDNVDRSWKTRYDSEALAILVYTDPIRRINEDMGVAKLEEAIRSTEERMRAEIQDLIGENRMVCLQLEEESQQEQMALESIYDKAIRQHSQRVNDFLLEEKKALTPFYLQMNEFEEEALHTILVANDAGAFDR